MAQKKQKYPKLPDEPKFKGRPPKAAIKEVREKRKEAYKDRKGKIVKVKKMDLFLEEFLKNGGNATEAAWKVFDCKDRAVAASVGSKYLKKAKMAGRVYLENEGMGYGKLLKTAVKKMEDSKSPEWWDRLMKIGGYEDFLSKKGSAVEVNILSAQNDFLDEYVEEMGIIEGEEVMDGEEEQEEE